MKIDLQPYVIPTHFLCAILNDDYTGLEDNEEAIVKQFLKDWGPRYMFISLTDEDSYFTRCHDLREYGILACDCMAVEIAFEPESEPDFYKDEDADCDRYNSIVCGMLLGWVYRGRRNPAPFIVSSWGDSCLHLVPLFVRD